MVLQTNTETAEELNNAGWAQKDPDLCDDRSAAVQRTRLCLRDQEYLKVFAPAVAAANYSQREVESHMALDLSVDVVVVAIHQRRVVAGHCHTHLLEEAVEEDSHPLAAAAAAAYTVAVAAVGVGSSFDFRAGSTRKAAAAAGCTVAACGLGFAPSVAASCSAVVAYQDGPAAENSDSVVDILGSVVENSYSVGSSMAPACFPLEERIAAGYYFLQSTVGYGSAVAYTVVAAAAAAAVDMSSWAASVGVAELVLAYPHPSAAVDQGNPGSADGY